MNGLYLPAIVVAAVTGFIISSVWYAVFADRAGGAGPGGDSVNSPPVWKLGVEFGRSLIVAIALWWLAWRVGTGDWVGALQLGLISWVGFPLVLLTGSVIWEDVPSSTAVIHAGDWLVKILAIAVIVVVWR